MERMSPPSDQPPYVAVCGGGAFDTRAAAVAEAVGAELARRGAVVVCGGLGGVMEAACRGARSEGGLSVAFLPGTDRGEANDYVDVVLPTGIGEMRNMLIVRAADVVIAIAGEFGTLSEVAFALRVGTPVVGLDTWELQRRGERDTSIVRAGDAADAVEKAFALLGPRDGGPG